MKKTALILTSLISIACAGQQLKTGSVLVKDSITVGGVGITEFSIDGTLGGNSDDAIPTEKAVKTYVDAATPAESDPVWVSDSADYINKSDTASYSSSILDRVVTSEADPVWVSDSADFVNTYEHGLKADKTAIDSLLGTGKYAIDTAAQNLQLRTEMGDTARNQISNIVTEANTTTTATNLIVEENDSLHTMSSDYLTVNGGEAVASKLDIVDSLAVVRKGVIYAEDYGVVFNDTANNYTTQLQNAINAAPYGKVILAAGWVRVDSVVLNYGTTLEGQGWGTQNVAGVLGTVIYSRTNSYIVHINIADNIGYGPTITNLQIRGDTSLSSQTGILINAESNVHINHVAVRWVGEYAIKFATIRHTDKIHIEHCLIHSNMNGIYGRDLTATQINAIRIFDCEIGSNFGYGINLIGANIVIRDNIIQDNDSAGVYLDATDAGAVTCNSENTVIEGNYFEGNGGGDIYAVTYYAAGPIYKYHFSLKIDNNKFAHNETDYETYVTACIMLKHTGTAANGFKDLYVGAGNYFSVSTGDDGYVDGGSILDMSATIYTNYYSKYSYAFATYWKNVSGANIIGQYDGTSVNGTGTITAGTGITNGMIAPVIRYTGSSAVDITASPQIVDGFYNGQLITILGNSNTNTLTLDDGTGLSLNGGRSCVIGLEDNITLRYNSSLDLWIEQSRSDAADGILVASDTISMSSQIGLKADKDSPTFTTAAYVPTAAATDSSTHAANTAWVKRHLRTRYEIDSLVISGSNIIAYEGGDTLSIYVPYANRISPVQYAAADTAGTTPAYIGQLFVDTRTGTTYIGNSTARGGWVILNYFFALCLIGRITRKDEV
jgi:hypothetical protein